jgi:uncharacterized protein YndB with AHSA1/START domain
MYEWMSEQAGGVERKVESTERDGKPARAVVAARSYPTAIDDLWDAITDPERIKRWFLPVSGDLRLGGRYQLKGNAGGTIDRCDPPRLLSVTWEFGGNTSWVNVRLEVDGEDDTKLTLEHIAPEDEAGLKFWDQFGPGAVGVGWDLGLLGLYEHLESPGEPMPKEEDLLTSPEGRALAATLSDGWRAANVAFGTDEQAAHESAARTTAFYTGVQADTGPDTGG